ncbi:MAG: hypothetical protein ISS00_01875 [Candidatus Marinimicrobia bacterium]|nr:hypothetical protein [Candidatus Neomarinimicrobiota bacterium]
MNRKFSILTVIMIFSLFVLQCGGAEKSETSAHSDNGNHTKQVTTDDVSAELGGAGFEEIAEDLGYTTYNFTEEDYFFYGDPRAVKGGTLRSITSRYPATLRTVGQNASYVENSTIEGLCYESLISTHPLNLEFVPVLATHWKISDDKMKFWFRIDPRARFSDGMPVTSDDVVATWDLLMDETILEPSSQLVYGKFSRPVPESKYIVSVECEELSWRNLLYFGGMSILPAHILNDLDGTAYLEEYQWKMLPGSGPYIIYTKDIVNQESFTLTRRTDYWGADDPTSKYTSNFDKIKFIVVKDNTSLEFEKFKNHEQDFYTVSKARVWVEECDFEAIEKGWIQKHRLFSERPAGTSGYAFNMRKWPFDDRRLRYVFAYLYNREKMNKEMYYSEYSMMNSLYSGSVYENPNNEKIKYNPRKAVKLLKEAGYTTRNEEGVLVHEETGKALSFDISIAKGLAYMVTPVQEMLKEYGIEMKIKFVDGNSNWKNMMQRNFTVFMQSFNGLVFPNPETSLSSTLADLDNNNNFVGFKNDRVDELLGIYDREFDQAKRVEIIREIDGIYSDIHPAAWGIARNYQRMLWWDKFGHPEYVVSRYGGDYRSIFANWWIDPEKEARLKKAMKNGDSLPVTEVDIKFWPEYLRNVE